MSRYTDIVILLNKYQTICCGVACMDCPFNDEGCRLEKMLLESPIADAVPVVRCKDCKFYVEHSLFGVTQGWCERLCDEFDRSMAIGTNDDDFCSHGKKKVTE